MTKGLNGLAVVALALAVGALSSAGCAKAQARTPGPAPVVTLTMPEPPTRLLIPVTVEPPPPPPASGDKPAVPAPPRPRPTATPTPTTPPTNPPGETPPVLQTGAQAEYESRAKDKIGAAERDLAKVQPATLGNEAKDQHASAVRFIRMAKEALTARNFVYAAYCAEKAATLAALLVKREF